MNKIILICLFLILPTIVYPWADRVVSVTDGNSIKVLHEGKAEKIRLYGVDTPEMGQPFGKRAKQFTSGMVFGKTVEVEAIGKDRYKRTIGIVKVGGTILNEELIRAGMAWVYPRYCKKPVCKKWKKLQEKTRKERLGLRKDPEPVPSWKWRRQSR